MHFKLNNARLLAGTKLKSTYKSLEPTTATRLHTVIYHTLTKFYNVIAVVSFKFLPRRIC